MTHVACESNLRVVMRSSVHPYPGTWLAIGRAVLYYARLAHAFSAGIKCRHCRSSTDKSLTLPTKRYLTQQKITHVKRLTNISDVRLLSDCGPFPVRCIYFCGLQHLCTNRQQNICAQTVDEYFGRPFAVRLCTNGWPIYRNEKEKKIQWKSRK